MAYQQLQGRGPPMDFGDDFGPDAVVQPAEPGTVPDAVKAFVSYLYHHIREKNVYEIYQMYDPRFKQLSTQYFPAAPWPHVDAIAPLVDQDHVFCLLYREMYFRDVFARLQPTLQQRCEAWENYCSLFQVVLHGNLNMLLPNQWLWDMVDEFVYQFQSFCQFRSKPQSRSEAELALLRDCSQVWNALGVCNYLQALADKSGIAYTLLDGREGGAADAFTSSEGYDVSSSSNSNVLRTLGYFSLVGLLRVHCLLGDYHTAMQRLSPIDLGRPGLFQRVIGCHVNVMYCYGFASMRLRRYVDAIKAFNQILLTLSKAKAYLQQMEASPALDQLLSRSEQLFGLLAVCLALCPSGKLVEEGVNAQLREKHGDKLQRMQRGDLAVFDELFSFACPKFVTPAPPDFSQPLVNYNQNAYRVQLKLFLADVRSQTQLPGLRAALALYSSISLPRLGGLLDTSEAALRTALIAYNHKNYVTDVDGTVTSNADLHFVIDDDVVRVVDQKPKRHFGEYFIRHISRLDEVVAELDAVKLD